ASSLIAGDRLIAPLPIKVLPRLLSSRLSTLTIRGVMTMSRRLWLMLAFSLLALVWGSQLTAQTPPSSKTIAFRTSEGTTLAFDVSPNTRSVVIDLLGQLWLLPASGGSARPITDAVRDSAEDLDPSFSPDGHRVLFSGERNGRTGLWLLSLDSGDLRQLTQ